MATPAVSRQYVLASRPDGRPTDADFDLVESPLRSPANGEVLVRVLWFSVDPYMRGRMRETTDDQPWRVGYEESWDLGDPMEAIAVGEVVDSRHAGFAAGDLVRGRLVWGDYCVVDGDGLADVSAVDPPTAALSVAGMPGRTAYFGLFDVGDPRPGDTCVVSAAAGAVGSVAVQLASMGGCRVVGVAGSDEKIEYVREDLGADAAIDYTATDDLRAAVAEACPDGVDVYFDNVGGPVTDAVVANLTARARVAVCGQVALYNAEETPIGPRHAWKLVQRQARMEGFSVGHYRERFAEADARLTDWLAAGELTYRESITEGLRNAPAAFADMLEGNKIGKQVVQVGEPGE